jgi:hypothetical protein
MSCAQKKTLFYWGNYSDTLYEYKKTPNDDNLIKHKEAIRDIIEKSKEKNMKVPPGIYCEYGYLLAKEGMKVEAKKYFELELNTYPESASLIKKLIQNL